VRGGTGFHANQAWRQGFEERYHLAAAKLLSDDDLLTRVDAMNLEYGLTTITLWHLGAGSGRRPPHHSRPNAPKAAWRAWMDQLAD
jgi:hypothetical protein